MHKGLRHGRMPVAILPSSSHFCFSSSDYFEVYGQRKNRFLLHFFSFIRTFAPDLRK